ncbi:MAG: DUF6056 family protein [Elusimicrobiaceae bacterium]|nr:DUF6056 family protein [Elusimicrobiota bacterium]
MLKYLKNTPQKVLFAWGLLFIVYIFFIFACSYLYPYGADEYILKQDNIIDALRYYGLSYMMENARIGLIANNIILYLGKWSFLLLNPIMQTIWVLSFFFLIYLRKPDFKTLKDFPAVLLIAVLSVFAVAQPDNTLFWIGGACNYSWSFLPFLWIMSWLRLEYKSKGALDLSRKSVLLLFIAAFALGMGSENASPLSIGLIVCFAAAAPFLKIKLRAHFYIIVFGLILGLAALFGAPAMWNRLNSDIFDYFTNSTLREKLLWHISHIHFYIKAVFMIPALLFLPLLVCALDKDKPLVFKNENYMLSLIFFLSSWLLAFVLFAVPFITGRCFYTASASALISFMFMLEYLRETYKFKIVKYASMLALAAALAFTPGFIYPYIHLHRQDTQRLAAIEKAQSQNKKRIFIMPYKYLKGPNNNLTIMFYDPVFGFLGYSAYIGMAIQTDESQDISAVYMFSNPNII